MALPSKSTIIVRDTAVTAITATAIAAGAFSTIAEATAVTTDAPLADAVLDVTFATAPVAGESVHLYRRDMNIDGTNDATAPSAGYKNIYVGSFPVALVATRQFISLPGIPLAAAQEFYIENGSTKATTGTTVLKITPTSYNAVA